MKIAASMGLIPAAELVIALPQNVEIV